ncbi:viral A-type inclusion protein [Niabella hirudinis]|uniref:viral A-type inclusion protein n=1 Tax=Niabella hirudinis TaxID=1285929 RepID=UPI003EB6F9A2
MKSFFFSAAIVLLMACGNSGQQSVSDTEDGPKTKADSLLQEVINGHDIAMPKMKKLERLMKESKSAIDSLGKLPAAAQKQQQALRAKLDTIYADLSGADKAMNEWMNGFKYDSLQHNEPGRIKYLEDQKTKVNQVKDAVLSSISKAEEVLGSK